MKGVIPHAVLALVGLALAWHVWTDEGGEASAEGIQIFDCSEDNLSSVHLVSERHDVVLEPRGEGDDRSYWITVQQLQDGEAPSEEREPLAFVGNAAVEEYLALVAPFTALRSLGDVDEDTLEEVGLKEPDTRIEIECGDRSVAYVIGGNAFGSGERYLMPADGGSVYLVNQAIAGDLDRAEHRFMQRELHRFDMTHVDTLEVDAFEQSVRLLQRERLDPQRAEWVDAEDPERRNEMYGNWLTRVTRLRAQSYLPVDAAPGSDLTGMSASPVPVLSLRYKDAEGEQLASLEVVRVDAEQAEYYARSETTRSWVKLIQSLAQQVEDEVRPVVGLERIERPEPEPPAPTEVAPTEGAPTGTQPVPPATGPTDPNAPPAPAGGVDPAQAPVPAADPHAGHGHGPGVVH